MSDRLLAALKEKMEGDSNKNVFQHLYEVLLFRDGGWRNSYNKVTNSDITKELEKFNERRNKDGEINRLQTSEN